MTTGLSAWLGFPPRLQVTERMLLSQLPEEDREPFMAFLQGTVDRTRSGEPVFPKAWYEQWKQSK